MSVALTSCSIYSRSTEYVTLVCTDSMALCYPVIPRPQQIEYGNREISFASFHLVSHLRSAENEMWNQFLGAQGLVSQPDGFPFRLELDSEGWENKPEGYTLKISDSEVLLKAGTSSGFFYGIQTLKQLLRMESHIGFLPEVEITDWPAFPIRGFMHDTGRNYQPLSQLKEQIEWLARYKYNVFHWHLTDNPGWRLESKIYPELQADRAFSRDVGKFYSQLEFLELLQFCQDRYITLIPEFDIPGHTEAFRKAFGIQRMDDTRVGPILNRLFQELLDLADADRLPFIHMGTDEVRNELELVDSADLNEIKTYLEQRGRSVLVWQEGMGFTQDTTAIEQLWAHFDPTPGHRYIDSRSNYVNHLDPFSGMVRLFYQQPTRNVAATDNALGGILCAWPDNRVAEPRDILRQNPIYPAMLFYADAIWKGKDTNNYQHWAGLPNTDTPEFQEFQAFEQRVIRHRDLFFKGLEFPYVAQSEITWQLLGPFDHGGNTDSVFPVELEMKQSYEWGQEKYSWTDPIAGGTVHLKHFFGFPARTDAESGTYYARTNIYSPTDRIQDFWIGFHGWSRAGGRRGGPFPKQGEWHNTRPKIWVNNAEIPPPVWQQPGLGVKSDEIPFIDEDYFYRTPTSVPLKAGWNSILLKIPHAPPSWKWMFTCVPVAISESGVKEVSDLRFNPNLNTEYDEE